MKSAKLYLNSSVLLPWILPVSNDFFGVSLAISFKTISLVIIEKENDLLGSIYFLMNVILGCYSNNLSQSLLILILESWEVFWDLNLYQGFLQ